MLKCPRCAVGHLISEVDKKMYSDVLEITDAKEKLLKRNEQKFVSLYKMSEPEKAVCGGYSLC